MTREDAETYLKETYDDWDWNFNLSYVKVPGVPREQRIVLDVLGMLREVPRPKAEEALDSFVAQTVDTPAQGEEVADERLNYAPEPLSDEERRAAEQKMKKGPSEQ